MSTRAAAGFIAAILLVVAVTVGLVPHSIELGYTAASGKTTFACGSAFSPGGDDPQLAEAEGAVGAAIARSAPTPTAADYRSECSAALGAPRVIGLGLGGLAVLALLFLLLTSRVGILGNSAPAAPENAESPRSLPEQGSGA